MLDCLQMTCLWMLAVLMTITPVTAALDRTPSKDLQTAVRAGVLTETLGEVSLIQRSVVLHISLDLEGLLTSLNQIWQEAVKIDRTFRAARGIPSNFYS